MSPHPSTTPPPGSPAAPGEDDSGLVRRIAAGDRAAFDTLYHRHHRKLRGYLLRILRRPELLDEVLDDVMLVVWRGAAGFEGRSRVTSWLFGIAYRQAMKALERDRSGLDLGGEEAAEAVAPGGGPESRVARRELRARIHQAMAALSPAQRAVVELTFFYGYSYPEIAEIVDCPVGTVKTRMFHARRLLKERLPDLEPPGRTST